MFFYRRPKLVEGLMQNIRTHRPTNLWLVADGPKSELGDEAKLCLETRKKIEEAINWPCEIHRIYADKNIGLPKRFESGLDELFAVESRAIILEEDCHPRPDFLPFCEAMLEAYESNVNIGGISGNCYLRKNTVIQSDYYFSRYLHTWGWATWARAWQSYKRAQWTWPAGGLREYFPEANRRECRYWNDIYQGVLSGSNDHWDYRWQADLWKRNMVAITPAQNLVENFGFGPEATHTKDESVQVGVERNHSLSPPYAGPQKSEADRGLDSVVFTNHFLRIEGKRNFWQKIRDRCLRFLIKIKT